VNKVKVVAAYRADDCLSGKAWLSDTKQMKQIYQTKKNASKQSYYPFSALQ
jgi:hypothetical protein